MQVVLRMKLLVLLFCFVIQPNNAEIKCLLKWSGKKTGICTELSNCPSALDGTNKNIYPCTCDIIGKRDQVCCDPLYKIPVPAQEKCKLPNDKEGICTAIKNCPRALVGIKKNIFPVSCGFEGNTPIVCCEIEASSKSREMCKKWREIIGMREHSYPCYFRDEYGHTITREYSLGGWNAVLAEYPHMAALGYGNQSTRSWSCGGSLISEKFILTAAHCLHSLNLGKPNIVRLGVLNLKDARWQSYYTKDYEIKRAIPHPKYKASSKYNDIALLELALEVQFNKETTPACLQVDRHITGKNWTATGWGTLGFNGPQPITLQKIYINRFSHEKCQKFYGKSKRLEKGVSNSKQICAGDDGVDTCEGDSGGPLQVQIQRYLYNIIGVTSFGKPCGLTQAPGVYTRVSKYVDWIESIVWP